MEYYPAEINHHCAEMDDNRIEMDYLKYLFISTALLLISSGLSSISERDCCYLQKLSVG